MAPNQKLADRVRQLLAVSQDNITEKFMFGALCFMVDEKMCVGIESERMMVRIGRGRFEEALEKDGVQPMDFTGKKITGMVYVDANVLNTPKRLEYWVNLALDYIKTARPARKKIPLKKPK